MKPRLIVHVGTPKTGSTSLQASLFESRGKLRGRCGVHYAGTDRSQAHTKHLSTANAALGNDPAQAEAEYQALIADFERSGADHLLISEEQLWSPRDGVAAFLQRFVPRFEVEVVAYLQRQDLFVEGLYNQHMRLRNYRGVSTIDRFWSDERVAGMLDYHRVLSRLRDAGLNVTVLEFSQEVQANGLIPSFLRAARLTGMGDMVHKWANASPDMRLLLTLSLLSAGRIDGQHEQLVSGLVRSARRLAETGLFPVLKHTLGSVQRDLLLQTYAESNARLAADFGITFPDERPGEEAAPILAPDAAYLIALIGDLPLTDSLKLIECCRAHLQQQLQGNTAHSSAPPPAADMALVADHIAEMLR